MLNHGGIKKLNTLLKKIYISLIPLSIASLEAHTTLNTYNLWKLALRGHLNIDVRTRDLLITRTMS